MAFIKSYFGGKINQNNNIVVSPTPTQNIKKSTNNENIESDNLIDTNNLSGSTGQEEFIKDGMILSNSETDKKYDELVKKSRTYQTEEEYSTWFETLSFEDQQLLEGYNVPQISQLTNELPYEGETFIVEKIISNNLLQVKSKISDLEKAEVDVKNWLSNNMMDSNNLVISWTK